MSKRATPDWRQIEAVSREVHADVAAMADHELTGMALAAVRVMAERAGHKRANALLLGLALRAAQGAKP